MEILDNGDVLTNLHIALASGDATKISKALKTATTVLDGSLDPYRAALNDVKRRQEMIGESMAEIGQTISKTFGVTGVTSLYSFEKAMSSGLKTTQDVEAAMGMAKAATAGLMGLFEKGIGDTNELMKSMMQIRSSAGMTSNEFKSLTDGITQAAAETGKAVGEVAKEAQNLFDTTGLKKGIGEVVTDAERMSRVFGSSADTFGKMAAQSIQFSEGTLKSSDLVNAFNDTLGLTGQRMDALLESMKSVGKSLRNMVGGGSEFSKAMKATTAYSSQMLAKFTELGGTSQDFTDIQEAILDPKKWGELGQKMPGLAANFTEMQKALGSGDMETFGKLVQDGAKRTSDMGKGMSQIARSAAGIDFTSAEILSKIDWKKVKQEGGAAGSVMERSAKSLADLGTQFQTFLNNISVVIMRVFGPIIEVISTVLGWVNAFLAANQGGLTDLIVWVGLAVAAWYLIIRPIRAAIGALKDFGKTAGQAIGEGVGKGAEAAMGGIANGMNKLAAVGLKAVVPLLAIGASLLLVAAGVWVLAQAMMVLSGVGWEAIGKGMVVMAGGILLMIGAAVAMAAIGSAVAIPLIAFGGAMLLVAAATWVFAQAISAIATLPAGGVWNALAAIAAGIVLFMAAAAPLLVPIFGQLLLAAMYGLAGAFVIFAAGAMMLGLGAKFMAEGVVMIVNSGQQIAALSSMDFSGLEALGKALGGLFINIGDGGGKINAAFVKNVQDLLQVIKDVSASMEDIIVTGSLLGVYAYEVSLVFQMLFNKDKGILVVAIKDIADSLNSNWIGFGGSAIDKGVMASITFIVGVLSGIGDAFTTLAAIGGMLVGQAGEVIRSNVTTALTAITNWITQALQALDDGLQSGINKDLTDSVMKTVDFVLNIFRGFGETFATLAAIGSMLMGQGGEVLRVNVVAGMNAITGWIVQAVTALDDGLQSGINKDLTDSVMKTVDFVMSLLTRFTDSFAGLAAIGSMLDQQATSSVTFKEAVQKSVDMMFGSDGIVQTMTKQMGKVDIKGDSFDSITKVMNSIEKMGDSVISIGAMGSVMKGGLRADMMEYAQGVEDFLTKMSQSANMFSAQDLTKMGQVGNVMRGLSDAMNKDIKISAQGGAEVALDEHDAETRAHHERVESLLSEIRDALKDQGGQTSQAVQKTSQYVPSWRPEAMFSERSETF